MTRARYLLVLAPLQAEHRRTLGVFATARGLDLVATEETHQALVWLDRHDPSMIVVHAAIPKAERVCHKARGKRGLAGIPILALSHELGDVLLERLYAIGVDDVVASSAWPALIARLRSLPAPDATPEEPLKLGRAVVADSDRGRCDVIGHVLANAGFELRYASDPQLLEYHAAQEDVRLVVLSAELTEPRTVIERTRAAGGSAAWIITAPQRELANQRRSLAELPDVALLTQHSPPADILFLANELTNGSGDSARASPRVLYGTGVAFRTAGADSDDFGFTYNISDHGLYVRTLAPPEGDTVWLELRPPRCKERVRLEGQIVWRSRFGRAIGTSAPPGFAVRLNAGLGDALARWTAAYEAELAVERDTGSVSQPIAARSGGGAAAEPSATPSAAPVAPKSVPPLERAEATPVPAQPSAARHVESNSARAESSTRPPASLSRALALAATVAGCAALLWVCSLQRQEAMEPSSAEPAAAAAARAASAASAAPAPAAPNVTPAPPAASSAKTAIAAASDATPEGAAPGAGALEPQQGWLVVSSSAQAFVYSNGKLVGPTNQPLKVRCGTRFLRVGGQELGDWIGEGAATVIGCGSVTRIRRPAERATSGANGAH